jgi:twinkle protein
LKTNDFSSKSEKPKLTGKPMEIKGSIEAIQDRGIIRSSAEFYGVTSYLGNHYYPYADESGVVVAAKVRNVENKDFRVEGQWSKAQLFGQQKFNKGGMYVTVVEGELDALAAFQMMGSKYPVVSVRNGAAAALKDCKSQYEWLDSFENIVVCFDADEPGRKAAQEVAELFGSKCKIFKASNGYKDACDYLKDGSVQIFTQDWWKAEQWQPDGIISAGSVMTALKNPLTKAPVSYPWDGLNKMLYGIRTSELVVLAAGSGLGKSTILRELVSHILNNTSDKVGLAFLEETPERTMRGLVGLEMNKKIHLPDAVYNPKEVEEVYANLDLDNRVYLWDHFGSNEIESVLNRLKYFVKALDCKWLVLDHLSILISDQAVSDERKALDMIMTKLRMFVQEVNCGLILVSHLTRPPGKSLEDGAATSLSMLRGSGSIAQLADAVIGAERNSQADDIVERNTTHVRVLKSRYTGYTGPACDLFYDDLTGRLREVDEEGL